MKKLIFFLSILTFIIIACTDNSLNKDCEKFSEQDIIDECYLKLSEKGENPIYCQNIKQAAMKDLCYTDSAIKSLDISFCNKIESTNPFYCYKKIADLTNDISICYDIKDPDWKELCLDNYAKVNSDFQICRQLPDIKLKNNCLINVSVSVNDEGICENIEMTYRCNEVAKLSCVKIFTPLFDCYQPIALSKKNPEICKKIEDMIFRSQCIKDIAVQEHDSGMCKIIEFDSIKQKCLSKTLG